MDFYLKMKEFPVKEIDRNESGFDMGAHRYRKSLNESHMDRSTSQPPEAASLMLICMLQMHSKRSNNN